MTLEDVLSRMAGLEAQVESLKAATEEPRDLPVETPPPEIPKVVAVVVGGGKRWDAPWSGTVSNFLKIPYDGVTQPTYAVSLPAMTAMPADDGTDDRAENLYIKISETPGPVFHVGRA
jgi:hypothetical protein